jgi:PAS domain S-box-containing protein
MSLDSSTPSLLSGQTGAPGISPHLIELAVEHSSEGFALCDAAGNFIYLNQAHCRMYGYENSEDLLGRSWRTLYREEDAALFDSDYVPQLIREGFWRGRAKGLRRDGSLFDELVSLRRIEGDYLLCTCSDVTSLRLLQEQLASSLVREKNLLATKSRFFSMANHELRNPLACIAIGVEMMIQHGDRLTQDKKAQIAADVLKRVETIRSLMDKFMVIGSQFSGVLNFHPAPWQIDASLRTWAAQNWWRPLSEDTDGRLRVRNELPEGETREADAVLVQHIVQNLVDNAWKYSGADQPIDLTVRGTQDELTFVVADRGPGLTAEEQERVFDDFYRAPGAKGKPGSGLGLFLVRQCARAHLGDITVSGAVGEGCVFTVRIHAPVSDHAIAAEEGS